MRRPAAVFLSCSLAVLSLLAGCASSPARAPITAENANAMVDAALAELEATARGNETSIREVRLAFLSAEDGSAGNFTFTWGQPGFERAQAGPFPNGQDNEQGADVVPLASEKGTIDVLCTPERDYLNLANGTVEARANEGWCSLVRGEVNEPRDIRGFNAAFLMTRNGNATLDDEGRAVVDVKSFMNHDQEWRIAVEAGPRIALLVVVDGNEQHHYGQRRHSWRDHVEPAR